MRQTPATARSAVRGVPDAAGTVGGGLHTIFRRQARTAPDRVALTTTAGGVSDGAGDSVSYGELDRRSDALARALARSGVGPDVLVALCTRRDPEAVVGMLGILKAGGAYVPIDPTYPEQRVRTLLADCGASVVVTSRATRDVLDPWPATVVPTDEAADVDADTAGPVPDRTADTDLAYVIYTSGSTGTPKGVAVEHRNVMRLFDRTRAWFGFDHDDTWALFHSISFDFSVWEIWGALLHGGRLVMLPENIARSPATLLTLLRSERVTVLNQTPSAFRQLSTALGERPERTDLRLVVFGGERLDPPVLAPWIAAFGDRSPSLVNMYGITETTVHCTYRRMTAGDLADPTTSPIGVPIPDLRIHLLDEKGRPVPDGEPGEIHVAGGGVARGYVNRLELTEQRFTSHLGLGEDRLYRSGDRAVRRGGELVYLGRLDGQLKVRGYRIEPGEIEHCLAAVPGVARAVVAPRDFGDGDVRLVAFLLREPGAAEDLALAAERHARARLPRHIRPAAYRVVSEIPMTLQGKVDLDALGC